MISVLKKKLNKKGFTLAELLIVIAIIGVLVAIAIPVFGSQLKKAEFATDLANVRANYAEVVATAMMNDSYTNGKIEVTQTALESGVKYCNVMGTSYNCVRDLSNAGIGRKKLSRR